jgi:mannose-6-phosphate isomerase-like protein (cupin superfamily)
MPRYLIQKPWGWTEQVTNELMFASHRIDINPGRSCSWHHHRHKWNGFACVTGTLVIDVVDGCVSGPPDKYETIVLSPGDTYDVPPCKTHRMRALPTGSAHGLEYYWPDGRIALSDGDIVRVSPSGEIVL